MHIWLSTGSIDCFGLLQAALLAGVGLQRLSLNDLCTHLGLPYPQLLALFNKARLPAFAVLACHCLRTWGRETGIHDLCLCHCSCSAVPKSSHLGHAAWPAPASTAIVRPFDNEVRRLRR